MESVREDHHEVKQVWVMGAVEVDVVMIGCDGRRKRQCTHHVDLDLIQVSETSACN